MQISKYLTCDWKCVDLRKECNVGPIALQTLCVLCQAGFTPQRLTALHPSFPVYPLSPPDVLMAYCIHYTNLEIACCLDRHLLNWKWENMLYLLLAAWRSYWQVRQLWYIYILYIYIYIISWNVPPPSSSDNSWWSLECFIISPLNAQDQGYSSSPSSTWFRAPYSNINQIAESLRSLAL